MHMALYSKGLHTAPCPKGAYSWETNTREDTEERDRSSAKIYREEHVIYIMYMYLGCNPIHAYWRVLLIELNWADMPRAVLLVAWG